MRDRVCLITGASSGIGKATAAGLAAMGAEVLMVCRDARRADEAATQIRAQTGSEKIKILLADLSSLAQVRQLAEQIHREHPILHVLINNAGLALPHRQVSADGLEMTFAVNHLAHFLLSDLLLDLLKKSGPARIINVSSVLHQRGVMDFDDLQLERKYAILQSYANTKLYNILFTYEQARRLAGSNVTANCLHPGGVSTRLGSHGGIPGLIWNLARPFMMSPEKGAQTSVYLASVPEVQNINGKYFVKCHEAQSSPASHDEANQKRLWEISAKLAGIEPGESRRQQ